MKNNTKNNPTNEYAVFGNPVEHSQSPQIHSVFARQTGQQINYRKQLVAIDSFAAAVESFFAAGGRGLNITVPFKLEAHRLAQQLSERARKAGAVNTLYWKNDLLCGDNTDGVGLCNDLHNNLQWPLKGAKVLVLGAGGAVRGVLKPVLDCEPASLVIANRTVEKAQLLADLFADDARQVGCTLSACGLDRVPESADIIINGTSASIAGDLPPISAATVNQACCYDMMYASEPTAFLRWAAENGARSIADGLGMLVEQAAESFYVWRGVRPKTQPVIQMLRQTL